MRAVPDPLPVDALTTLALQRLSQARSAADTQGAATLLLQAADQGDARASARLAVMAGAGIGVPQDWAAALDHLQQAAARGWPSARAELALLASPDGPAAAPVDDASHWHRLRRQVDLPRWLTLPPKEALSEAPRLRRFAGFAPPAVCRWLIDRAREKLARARTYDARTGEGRLDGERTNHERDFGLADADLVLTLVRARIAAAAGLPTSVMESAKVLHYTVGQQFGAHFDFIDPALPGLAAEIEARGQRLVTFLLYLNDDFDGGETAFLAVNRQHRGRAGDALMFANVDPQGRPDRQTLHAGLPPTRGEKWVLSQWIRDREPAAP